MILLSFLFFIVIILLPLALSLWKRVTVQKETGNEATDFYHHQLASLAHDYKTHLLDKSHYDSARTELQRRLLETNITPPGSTQGQSKGQFIIAASTLCLVPLLGLILYAIDGVPFLRGQSASKYEKSSQEPAKFLTDLQTSIAKLTPDQPDYVPKHILLGQLEAKMGLQTQAIANWYKALAVQFTPELAVQIAEIETSQAGHVTPEALSLYHKALDAAPKDAPWRLAVEARIASGEHEKDNMP